MVYDCFQQLEPLIWPGSHGHKILTGFDVCPNFSLPQVKQSEVINNKHGVYELPHKLLIDLRLRMLWNQRIPRKPQNFKEV